MKCAECECEIDEGRKFCSLSCSTKYQRKHQAWPVGYCEHCGSAYDARSRSGGRRKYCSRSCSSTARNLAKARKCARCSMKMSNTSSKQKYCSRECYHEDRYDESVRLWLAGEIEGGTWNGVSPFVRKWLIERGGEKCFECGWSEVHPTTGKIPVQVDHIDGDPYNHSHENVRLLCPNCHSLTSTYGILNRGNGRAERYSSPHNSTDRVQAS